MKYFSIFAAALALTLLSACYQPVAHRTLSASGGTDSAQWQTEADTLLPRSKRPYGVNSNFVVKADSMLLLTQQPEVLMSLMPTDSVVVHRGEALVVADIRILPSMGADSVWVQLADRAGQFGWTRERTLCAEAVPDDPISQFISTFSDTHLLIFLLGLGVIAATYVIRRLMRKGAPIVHFHDIPSLYPTLLALIVATAASFYTSIQLFAPQMWQEFYYHPTLNPFSVPPLLSIFLVSVWSMLIVGIATIDDVRSQLPVGEALTYLCGLAAVCAADYIVFSITTLYYVGYLLLAAYYWFAIKRYKKR